MKDKEFLKSVLNVIEYERNRRIKALNFDKALAEYLPVPDIEPAPAKVPFLDDLKDETLTRLKKLEPGWLAETGWRKRGQTMKHVAQEMKQYASQNLYINSHKQPIQNYIKHLNGDIRLMFLGVF